MVKKHVAEKKITLHDKKIADEQIRAMQKEIDYDTKDFTIELLVQKLKKDDFFIPDYQRNYIWRDSNKVFFIESIFLGLPIPFMFFADCKDGREEIIDGAQRMQTLVEFCEDRLVLNGLKKLTKLNGFSFNDLSSPQKRKFLNRVLRIVVLEEDTPAASRQDLFYRINTTGVKASPSEVRRGSYPGKFTNFIENCASDQLFIKLCPMSKSREDRHERFEFVLRFFAYVNNYQNFGHVVNEFLDEFLKEHIEKFDEKEYKNEFYSMLNFVSKNFPYGFAKSKQAKSTPRVRFEAISVGVALALRVKTDLQVKDVKWLNSDEFKKLTTSDGSNNEGRLRARIEYVRDQLLGKIYE